MNSGQTRAETYSMDLKGNDVERYIRLYHSHYHLWSARHFAKIASDLEIELSKRSPIVNIEHQSYVINTVISSVAFLESSVNEFIKDIVDDESSAFPGASIGEEARRRIKIFWDLTEEKHRYPSLFDKYQRTLEYCDKSQFVAGKKPYQNAKLVVEIRNELMHFKPSSYGLGNQHKLLSKLEGKFGKNPLSSGDPPTLQTYLGSGCANWAVHSVKDLADEFFARLDAKPVYQQVNL